jgi:hypothetical protein
VLDRSGSVDLPATQALRARSIGESA